MHFRSNPVPYQVTDHAETKAFRIFLDGFGYIIEMIASFCILYSFKKALLRHLYQFPGPGIHFPDHMGPGRVRLITLPYDTCVQADDITLFQVSVLIRYSMHYLEGPELFRYNDEDVKVVNGRTMPFGLMCDQYAESKGYLSFRAASLASHDPADWQRADDIDFGALKKRHGAILPITAAEYDAIETAFAL